jgi:hypothetical protein
VTRPSCLDSVPEYVEDCLRSCPRAGNGVHQWMARAAYRTFGHLDADEQTRAIRWAMRDCGRLPQPNEIERTISNICGRMANGGVLRLLPPLAIAQSRGNRRDSAPGQGSSRPAPAQQGVSIGRVPFFLDREAVPPADAGLHGVRGLRRPRRLGKSGSSPRMAHAHARQLA